MTDSKSAIYTGWVRHRRMRPTAHSFRYKVFMVYLDLDELEQTFGLSRLWSTKRWAPARFDRRDFHGDPGVPLKQSVQQTIRDVTGVSHAGPVRMLANLRYFGLVMNPLCTYYCFDEQDQTVQFIVAEVTNTPWRERHAYVLRCDAGAAHQNLTFAKALHVSPFNSMAMSYRWISNAPGEKMLIHLENWQEDAKVSDATLNLRREAVSASSLNLAILRYPWMTAKVAMAIYWQALRLWIKKVPLVAHPGKKSESLCAISQTKGASDEIH